MMPVSRRDFLQSFARGVGGLTTAPRTHAAFDTHTPPHASFDATLHLLNRITYGATPHDVARVHAVGLDATLEEQLQPDALDDSALETHLRQTNPIVFMDRATVHALGFDGRVERAVRHSYLARATHSRRQLYERMVEFWTDHFHVPVDSGPHDLVILHRDVIRRHALGRFRDLAFGVARSPSMLYYLDNHVSTAEHPNENYARELLELHTLGVDGGYTEHDVRETARALTGWQVHDGTRDGFTFNADAHDTDAKVVLGQHLPAGRGIEDGLHTLDLALHHPATARFVCRKLCVRFVADNPPADLVESAAQVWERTDGAIVQVLRHILTSQAFRASPGQKMRRPLEFFVAASRATGAQVTHHWTLFEMLRDLGQPPYAWPPPDGYPDVAAAWTASGLLLARWNIAMRLTHEADTLPNTNITTDIRARTGQPSTVGALVNAAATQVFGAPLPPGARAPFVRFIQPDGHDGTPVTPRILAESLGTLYGLMLASPYFQRH